MCSHSDLTFGYRDFVDGEWKWHCTACRSTVSGPVPTREQIRAAIVALDRLADSYREHVTDDAALIAVLTRFEAHQRRLADDLRRELEQSREECAA